MDVEGNGRRARRGFDTSRSEVSLVEAARGVFVGPAGFWITR